MNVVQFRGSVFAVTSVMALLPGWLCVGHEDDEANHITFADLLAASSGKEAFELFSIGDGGVPLAQLDAGVLRSLLHTDHVLELDIDGWADRTEIILRPILRCMSRARRAAHRRATPVGPLVRDARILKLKRACGRERLLGE
jgi:hypothetical protein